MSRRLRAVPVLLGLMLTPVVPLAPAMADVKNLNYGVRELEVTAEGADANAALQNCEIMALEQALQELIQTPAEKEKYQARRAGLVARRAEFVKRLQIVGKGTTADGGRFYRIRFAVDLAKLRAELVSAGVILSQQELKEQLNHPTIAAYYNDPREQSPYALWAVERLNNYLLAHQFKVIDAKVWQSLAAEDELLLQSQGSGQRLAQAMAQKARAEIFLSVQIEPKIVGRSGEFTYVQTPVQINAYEASSGEPFITKVYQRLNRQGEPEALAIRGNVDVTAKAVIEEAVAGAMPLVLADLTRHWKENLARGSQYRLRFEGFDAAQRSALEALLRARTRELKTAADGSYLVRTSGQLADLTDAIEEWFEETYKHSLKTRFDLGQAAFSR
ncbi:MAG: hypothetical protein IGS03_16165 [Candidatus Sericytochromatia bacterium]|nr:hypothetical protein [Candidatus Sericytochromatia bacterium]